MIEFNCMTKLIMIMIMIMTMSMFIIIIIIIIIISSSSSSSSSISIRIIIIIIIIISSSSTQRSARGTVDEMHVVFQKKCSRLGQKQLVKSTSMQKHTCLIWSVNKQKNGCRLGEMHLFEFTCILYKRLSKKRALAQARCTF